MRIIAKLVNIAVIQRRRLGECARSWLVRNVVEARGASVGKNFRVRAGAQVSFTGGASLEIGDNVVLAEGAELFVHPGARLIVGDGVFIGKGSVISSMKSVVIGAGSQIAHFATIIDSDHAVDPRLPLSASGHHAENVELGEQVWVGAGATVLKGVTIGRKAVVGAGAVVTHHVPAGQVAVGVPAVAKGTSP